LASLSWSSTQRSAADDMFVSPHFYQFRNGLSTSGKFGT
jgi:hypothetical protein